MACDWPGFTPDGALLLALEAADYRRGPDVLELLECTLVRKPEFHVTVLGRAAGAALMRALGDARIESERIAEIWRMQDWTVERTGPCLLLHRRRPSGGAVSPNEPLEAWSVIQCIRLPAMAAFRETVARLAGLDLPEAPPHVTLYVAGDLSGIAVPDPSTLQELRVRALAPAEVAQLGLMRAPLR